MAVKNSDYPYDPMQEEMPEDTLIWQEMLDRFWRSKKDIYNTFFVLRVLGSKLKIVDKRLVFIFGDEITDEIKKLAKKKYLAPNQDFIEVVMNKIASEFSDKKDLGGVPF